MMFDNNYLGHDFKIHPGSYGYRYYCDKCDNNIIYKNNKYFLLKTYYSGLEILSCDEMIIKGIIE
jgi:hypothetical protein